MKAIQLKTNIMCGSCIAKVTPVLNKIAGENNWEVDIKDPKKMLTVTTENVAKSDVIKALEGVGYRAEELI